MVASFPSYTHKIDSLYKQVKEGKCPTCIDISTSDLNHPETFRYVYINGRYNTMDDAVLAGAAIWEEQIGFSGKSFRWITPEHPFVCIFCKREQKELFKDEPTLEDKGE